MASEYKKRTAKAVLTDASADFQRKSDVAQLHSAHAVFRVQAAVQIAGTGVRAVDHGEERTKGDQERHSEKNSQHKECLAFIKMQDGVGAGRSIAASLLAGVL